MASWAETLHRNRPIEGLRVLQGLLSLPDTYPPKQLNQVCRVAINHHAWHLRDLKGLLRRYPVQETLSFLEEHPLIRPLSTYQQMIPDSFMTQEH